MNCASGSRRDPRGLDRAKDVTVALDAGWLGEDRLPEQFR
jgi:hypothetical protein